MVNSNYGWCIFSSENGYQFDHAVKSLLKNRDGRQSVCIYTRPSIQREWNDGKNAAHDFICTYSTQHLIRDGKLHYVVYMRSNDAIFGLINDFAWHCFVYDKMIRALRKQGLHVAHGDIRWNAASLHIYERHFELLKDIVGEYEANNKSLLTSLSSPTSMPGGVAPQMKFGDAR
jgi:thymidylate synthase